MSNVSGQLKKIGLVNREEAAALQTRSIEERIALLSDMDADTRSAAAISLLPVVDEAAEALLARLSVEYFFYTRMAICESLEKGSIQTAEKMTEYLGLIGKNQHKELPARSSAKKSFPQPRDIIARTMGKMNPAVFPVLLRVLGTENRLKIREALDAIGYMAFYQKELADDQSLALVLNVLSRMQEDQVLVWKVLTCLSAFPEQESRDVLEQYAGHEDLLGEEARRSLRVIRERH